MFPPVAFIYKILKKEQLFNIRAKIVPLALISKN